MASSAELSAGKETDGLDWYGEHGFRVRAFSRLYWYLFPELKRQGIRFELPYQEQLLRIGRQLGRRLHEKGISWWDKQLEEYRALPEWKDFPAEWEEEPVRLGRAAEDYPF